MLDIDWWQMAERCVRTGQLWVAISGRIEMIVGVYRPGSGIGPDLVNVVVVASVQTHEIGLMIEGLSADVNSWQRDGFRLLSDV